MQSIDIVHSTINEAIYVNQATPPTQTVHLVPHILANDNPIQPHGDDFIQLHDIVNSRVPSPHFINITQELFVAATFTHRTQYPMTLIELTVLDRHGAIVLQAIPEMPNRTYTMQIRIKGYRHDSEDVLTQYISLRQSPIQEVAAAVQMIKRGRRLIGSSLRMLIDSLSLPHDNHLLLDVMSPIDTQQCITGNIPSNFAYDIRTIRSDFPFIRDSPTLLNYCHTIRHLFTLYEFYLQGAKNFNGLRDESRLWLLERVGSSGVGVFQLTCMPWSWDDDWVNQLLAHIDDIELNLRTMLDHYMRY